MTDHNTNLYVTLMGRYGGFQGLNKFTGDFNRLSGQFGSLGTKAQRQAALTEMALRKQAAAATSAADVAIRAQGRINASLTAAGDRVEKMERRLTLVTKQQIDLRQRALQGYYDGNVLRYNQMREKLDLQEKWITADLEKQLAKRDALRVAANDAATVGAARTAEKIAAANQLSSYTPPAPGMGEKLSALAMNPYVQGAAMTVGAGGYAAYKLAGYYNNFQKMTQTTAANTNMSPAALRAYRRMLPIFRTQYPGSMADVNNAFFHAMSLGFRGRGGMPNSQTYAFVRQVMQSALPTGATPGDVSSLLGGAVNAYRGNAGVPRHAGPNWFMNVLHAIGATGNMTVEDMAQVFGPVMAMSSASGSRNSLRQAGAMLDTLTQMGYTPNRGATNIAQVFQKMEHPSSGAQKLLAGVYYKTGDNLWGDFTPQGMKQRGAFGVLGDLRAALQRGDITKQDILTIFPGTRGGQAILSLLSQGGQRRLTQSYRMTAPGNAQGQTGAQFRNWMGTRAGQTAERNALLGQVSLWAGQGSNKAITDLTDKFNKATIAIGHFVKGNQALVYGAAHVIGSLGAFAFHMGPLYVGFKMVNGVIGVTNTLLTHGFVAALRDAGSRIKSAFLTPLGDLTNVIKPWGGKVIGWIGSGITHALPGLRSGPLAHFVGSFHGAFNAIASKWASVIGFINSHMPGGGSHPSKPAHFGNTTAMIRAAGPAPKGTPSGFPNPNAFGIGTPAWYRDSITNPYSPYITAQDSQGTLSLGGGAAAHDFNYGVPTGSPVRLPIAAKLLKVQLISGASGWGGWYVYFRAQNGGVFFYEHLNDVGVHSIGKTYAPGTVVGHSGQPTGVWGSGAQMSITADARATAALRSGNSNAAAGLPAAGGGRGLPTPPPQGVGATGSGPIITAWEKRNWAMLASTAAGKKMPMGALLAILGNESGGGMNKSAGANVMQMTPVAAAQIGFTGAYGSNAGSSVKAGVDYFMYLYNGPAHHDLWTAFYMYNGSGPAAVAYANKAMAAANAYGAGHQITALHRGAATHGAPYANALYSEHRRLTALAAPWHGISVSKLPVTGGLYSQSGYLHYEYQRNQLERQIADNTAKQYALAHHMSPAWLKHMLIQDKATLNAQNKAARESLAQKQAGANGAASRSVPVHIIGRCAAEAAANKHRQKTAHHAERIEHNTLTSAQILAKIYHHITRPGNGHGGRQGRDNPKVIGLHQSVMPGY